MTSGSVAGAETMTFAAPPFSMCWMMSGRLVYLPVDSMTTETPRSFQGSLPTSFSARTRTFLPLTTMASSVALTSSLNVPRTESYLSRWARVLASVMSLTATYSMSGSFQDARSMFRPILPKPLIPIRMAMETSSYERDKSTPKNITNGAV